MTTLEAIAKRKSRRTYLDTPIAREKAEDLDRLITQYCQESDLLIRLISDGSDAFNGMKKSYGLFKNVRTLIAIAGKTTDADLLEKAGRYGELLMLEATKMELGTCWVAGTFDRESSVIKVRPDETLVAVITLGNVDNVTLKEKAIRAMIARKVKPLEEFYVTDAVVPDWFVRGIQAVQKAPSAKNRQAIKFEYKEGQVTAYIAAEEPYRMDPVDLGIAKIHFELAAGGCFEIGDHGKYVAD